MIDGLMTDAELALLVELLEAEREELLPEIHHTEKPAMKDQLHARLRTVDRMIERFQQLQAEKQQQAQILP